MAEDQFDPWRKHRIIQIIAAVDILVATLSIFYNGKTLLVIFDGLHRTGQEKNWLLVFLILFITFGIQLLHIVLAMLLFRASRKDSIHLQNSVWITRFWLLASIFFLVLLIVELYVGMTTFEYNNYIIVFSLFVIGKILWRVFTLVFVKLFKKDLEHGLRNYSLSHSHYDGDLPVFKMILTSPENCDLDLTDNETQTKALRASDQTTQL